MIHVFSLHFHIRDSLVIRDKSLTTFSRICRIWERTIGAKHTVLLGLSRLQSDKTWSEQTAPLACLCDPRSHPPDKPHPPKISNNSTGLTKPAVSLLDHETNKRDIFVKDGRKILSLVVTNAWRFSQCIRKGIWTELLLLAEIGRRCFVFPLAKFEYGERRGRVTLQHVSVTQQLEPSNMENRAQPERVRGALRISRVLAVFGGRHEPTGNET